LPVIALGRDAAKLAQLPSTIETWADEKGKAPGDEAFERLSGGLVLHLAGVADRRRVNGTASDAALAYARDMAELASAARLRGVVLVSSIYASLEEQGSTSAYGAHKLAVERLFGSSDAVPTLILRLPPVYGPRLRGSIPLLAKLVRRGVPIPFGRATEPRDYLAMGNLLSLLQHLSGVDHQTFAQLHGLAVEPSDGSPVTTAELVRMIGQVIGRRPLLLPIPEGLVIAMGRWAGKANLVEAAFHPLLARGSDVLARQLGWRAALELPETLNYLRKSV
jgi:UDP-glucose 4-epimerase